MSLLLRRLAAVAVAAVAAMVVLPAPADADPASTQLNASDMTLLNGVRQAGLWEIPAGQMAAQKGSTARVRQVGQAIATQTPPGAVRRSAHAVPCRPLLRRERGRG